MPSSVTECAVQAMALATECDHGALNRLLSRTPAAWKSEVFHKVLSVPNLSRACLDVMLRQGLTISTGLGNVAAPPLSICSDVGNLPLVRYLVEQRKADLEGRDQEGRTALAIAALAGHMDVVRYLLDRGADMGALDNREIMPIYYAAYFGKVDIVRLFLDRGSSEGRWPSICGAAGEGHTVVVELLLSRGRDINARNPDHWAALDFAILNGHAATVSFLLDRGATFLTHRGSERVPVVLAAEGGHTEVLRLLLDRGLPVFSIRNDRGSTCLHAAAASGKVETASFLLDRDMEVDVRRFEGNTPLFSAINFGAVDCVRVLLERGASLEVYGQIWTDNRTLETPLMFAAARCRYPRDGVDPSNYLAILELLLDRIDRSEDPGRLLMMPGSNGTTAPSYLQAGSPAFPTFLRRLRIYSPQVAYLLTPLSSLDTSSDGMNVKSFEFYSYEKFVIPLQSRKKHRITVLRWSSLLLYFLDFFPPDLRPFESEPDAVYVEALASKIHDLRRHLHALLPSQCGRGWTESRLAWFKAGRSVQRRMEQLLRRATAGHKTWGGVWAELSRAQAVLGSIVIM